MITAAEMECFPVRCRMALVVLWLLTGKTNFERGVKRWPQRLRWTLCWWWGWVPLFRFVGWLHVKRMNVITSRDEPFDVEQLLQPQEKLIESPFWRWVMWLTTGSRYLPVKFKTKRAVFAWWFCTLRFWRPVLDAITGLRGYVLRTRFDAQKHAEFSDVWDEGWLSDFLK